MTNKEVKGMWRAAVGITNSGVKLVGDESVLWTW